MSSIYVGARAFPDARLQFFAVKTKASLRCQFELVELVLFIDEYKYF